MLLDLRPPPRFNPPNVNHHIWYSSKPVEAINWKRPVRADKIRSTRESMYTYYMNARRPEWEHEANTHQQMWSVYENAGVGLHGDEFLIRLRDYGSSRLMHHPKQKARWLKRIVRHVESNTRYVQWPVIDGRGPQVAKARKSPIGHRLHHDG